MMHSSGQRWPLGPQGRPHGQHGTCTYRQVARLRLSTRQSLADAMRQVLLLAAGDRANGLFLELDRHGGLEGNKEGHGSRSEKEKWRMRLRRRINETIARVIAAGKKWRRQGECLFMRFGPDGRGGWAQRTSEVRLCRVQLEGNSDGQ